MKRIPSCLRLAVVLVIAAFAAVPLIGQGSPAAPDLHGAILSPTFGKGRGGLDFIENRGQIVDAAGGRRPDILFTASAGAMRIYLRRDGISYVLRGSLPDAAAPLSGGSPVVSPRPSALFEYRMDLQLIGSNPRPEVIAEGLTPYRSNYYLGHCPEGITDVKSYGRVIYREIYPKIDLAFSSDERGIKYDFIVRPGGDPAMIRLRYDGGESVGRESGGSLAVRTPLGALREGRPYSYQGAGQRREVRCGYTVAGDEVRFDIGRYDRGEVLVIDPLLEWATYCGGTLDDAADVDMKGTDIVSDDLGSVTMITTTSSTNFPPATKTLQPVNAGARDAALIKLDVNGNPSWGTYFGGSGSEKVGAIAISGSGNLAVCGSTNSTDFPIAAPRIQGSSSGGYDMFVGMFTPTGSRMWATYCGGTLNDFGRGIDISPNGNIAIAGSTSSSNIPTAFPLQPSLRGSVDAYVAQLDGNGAILWGTYCGGSQADTAWGVASNNDVVVITGSTTSHDMLMNMSSWQRTFTGGPTDQGDVFLMAYGLGGSYSWSTYFGGTDKDVGTDIDLDNRGRAVICGYTLSYDFATSPDAYQGTHLGTGADPFVACFGTDGQRVWATLHGGRDGANGNDADDRAFGVCTSINGDVYITGYTLSNTLRTHPNAYQNNLGGTCDAFLVQVNWAGAYLWSSYFGRSSTIGYSVATDAGGAAYLAGRTTAGLPNTQNGFQPNHAGAYDAFITKTSGFCYPLRPTITSNSSLTICYGGSITLSGPPGFSKYTWVWKETNDWRQAGGQSLVVTAAGRYTLTVENANGCTDTVGVDVFMRPRPPVPTFHDLVACEGDSVELNATHANYVGYLWSTGETTPSIWVHASGTYTVKLTDRNGCEVVVSAEAVIVPLPRKPTLKDTIWLCPGTPVPLDATVGGDNTYKWSNGQTSPILAVTDSGRYSVRITNKAGCWILSDTVVALLRPRIRPRIRPLGKTTFCEGDSVILVAEGGPFRDMQWASTDFGSTKFPGDRLTVFRSGTYTLEVIDTNGCKGDTSIKVTVVPPPNTTIAGPDAVCFNAKARYRARTDADIVYQWDLTGDGAITSATEGTSITVQWGDSGSGVITLTAVDTVHGCSSVSKLTVTLGSDLRPVITAATPFTFCEGDSVVLDAGEGYAEYRWSSGDTTRTVTVRAIGTYTVAVRDSMGCSGTSAPIDVWVESRPTPSITGPAKVCINTRVNYLTADVPGHKYTWYVVGGSIASGQGTPQITVQWGSGGTASVDLLEVNSLEFCQAAAPTFPVEIGTQLEPRIAYKGPLDLCEGDSITLDAGDGYADYRWSTGQTTRTITVRQSGAYRVTVSDDGGCSGSSPVVTVTMHELPNPLITPDGSLDLCSGDSVTLDAGVGYATYQWSTGQVSRSITVGATGQYSVTVGSVFGCQRTSPPVVVTVEPTPTPAITGPAKVCQNSTIAYSTSGAPGHAYHWTITGGTLAAGQGAAQASVQWGSDPTGVVELVEISANGRCSTSVRYAVSIGTELEPVVSPSGRIDLCSGDSVELDAGDGYARYAWTSGQTTRRITVSTAGQYSVRVWDAGGCSGSSAPVDIAVHALPVVVVTPSGPTSLVAGQSVELDAGAGYTSYRWSSGQTTRRITASAVGGYSVAVVDSNGCGGVGSIELTLRAGSAVASLPVIDAVPGERVRIAVRLSDVRNMPVGAVQYRARLRYRASVLAPVSAASHLEGADRVVEITGSYDGGATAGDELVSVEMVALLGDTSGTVLHLDSLVWSDPSIATELRDGELRVIGLCESGPQRLVGAGGSVGLKVVRPNPLSDRGEIEYEVAESGRTVVEVVDLFGRVVGMVYDGEIAPGSYVSEVRVSGLSSGVYFVVLRTPSERKMIPMRVQH